MAGASSVRGRVVRTMVAAVILIAPAACGGSDGDTSAVEATTVSTDAPAVTSADPAGTAPDDEQPLIAFQTTRGGEVVGLINRDGSGIRSLEMDAGSEQGLPDWSHDGTRLVVSTRSAPPEPVYLYDLESGAATALFGCTDPCIGEDEPAWSPDDTRVAFIRYLGPLVGGVPSDCGLWIGDVATGEARQVSSHPGCDPRETSPRWSPDGTQLTYWFEQYSESGAVTGTAVFVMDADGTGVRQLTDFSANAGDADWSPDGEWIVYATHPLRNFQGGVVSNLFRMHPDGTGTEQLTQFTDPSERATQPRYTPDGTQILFTLVTTSRDLALLPASGGEIEQLTHNGLFTHGTMQPTT